MADDYKTDLVPCSQCGAPVLTNLAECMFCGQTDPGKLASNPLGKRYVNIKHATRKRIQTRQRRNRQPDVATTLYRWRDRLLSDDRGFVNGIIAVCVALFVLSYVLGTDGLYKLGATGTLPISDGRIWTPITAIYLHGGILHILFNMLWVYQLGPVTARIFGRSQFFLIYTIAGIFGALVSILAGTPLTVGASGAIFGLFGAIIFVGYREGNYLADIARQYAILAVLMLILGFTMPNVDNWGHIGGFIGGILATLLLMDYPLQRFPSFIYDRMAIATALLTVAAIIFSLIVSF